MRYVAGTESLPVLQGSPSRFGLIRLSRTRSLLLHSPPAPLFSFRPVVRLWQWPVPPFVPKEVRPLTYEEAAGVRARYTGGGEYFLLPAGPEPALRAVLSGFSAFKRRLKSSLQLVICGPLPPALQKDLGAYRYRSDLQLLPAGATAALTGAAYAVLLPEGGDRCIGLGAQHCSIPLITADTPEARDLFGTAALFAEAEEWGGPLQRIYTDEALWSRTAAAGPHAAAPHTFERSAALLLQHITFAAKSTSR